MIKTRRYGRVFMKGVFYEDCYLLNWLHYLPLPEINLKPIVAEMSYCFFVSLKLIYKQGHDSTECLLLGHIFCASC